MSQDNGQQEPEKFDMSIQDAAAKWPDSTSRAFYLGNNEDSLYFMKTSRAKKAIGTARSRVECIKLHAPSGTLVSTTLTIKAETIINPISFKKFVDKVHEVMRALQEQGQEDALNNFKIWNFSLETQNSGNDE